jgi:H+/gluconate symporter-like permease
MVTFLNWFGRLCAAAVGLAILLGYLSSLMSFDLTYHVLVGLVAALASILSLSLVMFYFIATGKHIKEAATQNLVDAEDYYRTRRFKAILFPLVMVAIALLIVAPVLGAAYDAKKLELFYHSLASWATFGLLVFAVIKIKAMLVENKIYFDKTVEAVNADVDRRRAEAKESDTSSGATDA